MQKKWQKFHYLTFPFRLKKWVNNIYAPTTIFEVTEEENKDLNKLAKWYMHAPSENVNESSMEKGRIYFVSVDRYTCWKFLTMETCNHTNNYIIGTKNSLRPNYMLMCAHIETISWYNILMAYIQVDIWQSCVLRKNAEIYITDDIYKVWKQYQWYDIYSKLF